MIPAIGDWLMPRDGSPPGMVVDILPSGKQCVLARRLPSENYSVIETVHDIKSLKGPMTGKAVL